jgi:hypothetical protein
LWLEFPFLIKDFLDIPFMVIGKDAAMALESRRNMSDREFQNMMKKQINL